MVRRSRYQRVKSKRETKQAMFYFLLAIGVMVVLFVWGIPAFARLASLITPDDTNIVNIEDDGLRPAPPVLFALPEATPSASLDINGFAASGNDIVLYHNNKSAGTVVADGSGEFNFRDINLESGKNIFYVIAKSGDKESEKSKIYEVYYDNSNPVIEITSPESGSRYYGQTERLVTIKGTVDEDVSSLTAGERVVIVTSDGSFSINYQLDEGEQTIEFVATDKAGNQGSASIVLSYEN